MKLYKLFIAGLCVLFVGCTGLQTSDKVVAADPNTAGVSRLAKSDINEVVEHHQRGVIRDLKLLMLKLYRRNPSGRHDKQKRTIEQSVDRFFSRSYRIAYPQWQSLSANDIVRISLDETYQGSDRVVAFIYGLRKMLMASYDNHTEFYYLTSIDEQKLYNSARNIEISAWMLAEKRNIRGDLLLLSDSCEVDQQNLSYQRLFGRMIATQDNLAEILAHKSGRIIKTVVVRAATFVFLPI